MPRGQRLTKTERRELGAFLALVAIGCLGLAAVLHMNSIPRGYAAPAQESAGQAIAGNSSTTGGASGLQLLPLPIPTQSPLPPAERAAWTSLEVIKTPVPLPETRTYNGKTYKYLKTISLRVTAYAPDPRCTYPYPGTTTASGLSVTTNGGKLVAADTAVIPMYSLVSVPGYASAAGVPVLDRGGAIKGNRLDVLLPTFEQAKAWGSRTVEVKIFRPANL